MPAIDKPAAKYYSITKTGTIKWKEGSEEKHSGSFVGHIRGVRYKEDEYQGDKIHRVIFVFRDANGSEEFLQCGLLSSAGKSIMNTILGTTGVDHLEITPYLKDYNGKEYVNVWVKVNGQRGEWKYSPADDFPKADNVTLPSGKVVKDDANVLPFFIRMAEEADQLVSRLPAPAAGSRPAPSMGEQGGKVYGDPKPATKKPDLNDWDGADDDLPF